MENDIIDEMLLEIKLFLEFKRAHKKQAALEIGKSLLEKVNKEIEQP